MGLSFDNGRADQNGFDLDSRPEKAWALAMFFTLPSSASLAYGWTAYGHRDAAAPIVMRGSPSWPLLRQSATGGRASERLTAHHRHEARASERLAAPSSSIVAEGGVPIRVSGDRRSIYYNRHQNCDGTAFTECALGRPAACIRYGPVSSLAVCRVDSVYSGSAGGGEETRRKAA